MRCKAARRGAAHVNELPLKRVRDEEGHFRLLEGALLRPHADSSVQQGQVLVLGVVALGHLPRAVGQALRSVVVGGLEIGQRALHLRDRRAVLLRGQAELLRRARDTRVSTRRA